MQCTLNIQIGGRPQELRQHFLALVSDFLTKHDIIHCIEEKQFGFDIISILEIRYDKTQCQVVDKFFNTINLIRISEITELVELLNKLDFSLKFEKELE